MAERHLAGERLSSFLDDELDDDTAIAAARHLDRCERCLGELESLRATRDALRHLPHLQAPVLTAGLERRSLRWHAALRRARLAVLALVFPVVLLAVAYVAGGDLGEVEPPTDVFLVEHLGRTGGGPVPSPVGGR